MINEKQEILKQVLEDFDIDYEVGDIWVSPSVTTYFFKPTDSSKIKLMVELVNDFALALKAHPVRVVAPQDEEKFVRIEVPNEEVKVVSLADELVTKEYKEHPGILTIPLGKDTHNVSRYVDLRKQICILVGGATGSGKSVFFHSIIATLTQRYSPQELKLILIDAKRIEYPTVYKNSPYLIWPVMTMYDEALKSFKWCLGEIDRRIELMVAAQVKTLENYNKIAKEKLPYIVILIDEFADFAVADESGELIDTMVQVIQPARLAGIVIAMCSSRPCIDTYPAFLADNIGCKMAFSTASEIDAKFVLGQSGAEKLLGKGDALFLGFETRNNEEGNEWTDKQPVRLQTPHISDEEIAKLVKESIK